MRLDHGELITHVMFAVLHTRSRGRVLELVNIIRRKYALNIPDPRSPLWQRNGRRLAANSCAVVAQADSVFA
jgi:hypothetical protein